MTQALAWPMAVVVLGVLYRKSLQSILDGVRLRQFKKGDWEANFEIGRQEVRALTFETTHGQAPESPHLKEIESLARTSPDGAILSAWKEVETEVMMLADRAGIKGRSFPDILNALQARGAIETSTKDSIIGLRNLRNLAVHSPPREITTERAQEFATMANAAVWSMKQNFRRVFGDQPG
jgi:hypothetical protein